MSKPIERASRWIYRGVWAVLVRWFKVPEHPPTLPTPTGETLESFRPAEGFLRYLKLYFWIVVLVTAWPFVVGLTGITVAFPGLGLALVLPVVAILLIPYVLGYLAIHLRYDSTWYVMTSRSLRIRRGIWIIHETTITFENVQNVAVSQGPIQRLFGIADVRVDTAGGGGKSAGHQGSLAAGGHKGLIEGVSDATRIRDLILSRLRHSRSAGLGDEARHAPRAPTWTPEHLAVLREMRELVAEA